MASHTGGGGEPCFFWKVADAMSIPWTIPCFRDACFHILAFEYRFGIAMAALESLEIHAPMSALSASEAHATSAKVGKRWRVE